jgi:DHA1 family florfenicol/chloramphenicol resistance protein-like MFS transporter
VATFATVRDIYAGRPEGNQIYGILGSLLALVPAFGPVLGAYIHTCFGWRAIFMTLAVFMLIPLAAASWLWPETRKKQTTKSKISQLVLPLKSLDFWRYTLGYSAGMGAFFVYFSTAPGVMIKRLGFSELDFSFIFASVALVMMAVARFIGKRTSIWGLEKTLARAMYCLLSGAFLMALAEMAGFFSVLCYMAPMWVIAWGIAMAAAVGPNGALKGLDHLAGAATAVYYTLGGLILGIGGTISVLLCPKDTGWPVAIYCFIIPLVVLSLRGRKDYVSKVN